MQVTKRLIAVAEGSKVKRPKRIKIHSMQWNTQKRQNGIKSENGKNRIWYDEIEIKKEALWKNWNKFCKLEKGKKYNKKWVCYYNLR